MSQAGSQAWAFYRDVAKNRVLWTVENEEGIPMTEIPDGRYAIPFWSSLSRVRKIAKMVSGYANYEPCEVSWDSFCSDWVPSLTRDGILVGLNWSGKKAIGYDGEAQGVMEAIKAVMAESA